MDLQHRYRTLAAAHLVLAGIVLIATPNFLNAPNAIGLALGVVSVLIAIGIGAGQLPLITLFRAGGPTSARTG